MTLSQKPGFRWLVLGVATIAQATACFLVQGLGALSSNLQASLELNAFEIGLLVSAAQIVPVLGLLVAGELLVGVASPRRIGLTNAKLLASERYWLRCPYGWHRWLPAMATCWFG
jgi:hypothetical protein